jgi:YD repeat-containing protein
MRNTYDLEGRVSEVATFSGDTQPPDSGTNGNWTGSVVTTFNGEVTTVRDQANKQRRSTVDGLGRLASVDELFDYPSTSVYSTTSYGYDARGNLKSVSQSGQSRTFSYDGLSRLTDATNPENGHIGYTYDLASNLATKTDGRFTTTYGYDSLNRVLTRTYTGTPATPPVSYAYDTSTNGVGRLASVTTSGVSTYTYTTYDPMGRPTAYSQATNSQTYTMGATYNKAGMELTETYPSGRVISTAYDNAGRLNGITGQKTLEANKTYASSFSYTAHGAIGSMQLGNNLWEHSNFNSRLQPTQIGLGTTSSGTSSIACWDLTTASAPRHSPTTGTCRARRSPLARVEQSSIKATPTIK